MPAVVRAAAIRAAAAAAAVAAVRVFIQYLLEGIMYVSACQETTGWHVGFAAAKQSSNSAGLCL